MRVLVANAGSSSLKLRLLEPDDHVAASKDLTASRGHVNDVEIAEAIRPFGPVDVVGHRIVHGGTEFTRAVRVNEEVVRRLHALADLAPLHQPVSLAVLAAVSRALPEVPAVACFDTAFHAAMPAAAATYALPVEWRHKWNLRRYGFHGLSHAYAARRAIEIMNESVDGVRVYRRVGSAGTRSHSAPCRATRGCTPARDTTQACVRATRGPTVSRADNRLPPWGSGDRVDSVDWMGGGPHGESSRCDVAGRNGPHDRARECR